MERHSYNLRENYGYKTFRAREHFEDALESLYRNEILPAIENGLCAAVYTQLSDVEDETNGLVTYDRKVEKVRTKPMQKIAEDLYAAFSKQC